MSLRDLQEEAGAWKRWERGQGPEPRTREPVPIGRIAFMSCDCGEKFTAGQFNAAMAHFDECSAMQGKEP